MFEIGFSELVMVGLVSLLVIGPERLPKVARLAGFWIGKTRNMVNNFKAEIKHELETEEIRQIMEEQSGIKMEVTKALDQAADSVTAVKSSIEQASEQISAQNKSQYDSE
ncbi:MAG: Sec-independent protein translocase protein TatB [Methylococcaceae bacterium]|jgi:sec-independent protein translocase protein TatB|nr:Sec-independent protein translocase protein TatB [Methylococcaceae bacterium]MDZ4157031.1 Sec-independent protein translocase protein TatB [Methylococcales bacterium]MDP2394216.1 Sec-independent protein translocase protein TatB [Methylococcaceae bacterium]MDP3020044.1 Sec-independent protein translocase protein TatB [Methylococcaceae bacterium]MDP3388786.1 Sec-independent protein translocase protein TatB [Methylococcaceae bacterium]